MEINVNFQPQIMAAVTSIAYLDVAGQEERIGVEYEHQLILSEID